MRSKKKLKRRLFFGRGQQQQLQEKSRKSENEPSIQGASRSHINLQTIPGLILSSPTPFTTFFREGGNHCLLRHITQTCPVKKKGKGFLGLCTRRACAGAGPPCDVTFSCVKTTTEQARDSGPGDFGLSS